MQWLNTKVNRRAEHLNQWMMDQEPGPQAMSIPGKDLISYLTYYQRRQNENAPADPLQNLSPDYQEFPSRITVLQYELPEIIKQNNPQPVTVSTNEIDPRMIDRQLSMFIIMILTVPTNFMLWLYYLFY